MQVVLIRLWAPGGQGQTDAEGEVLMELFLCRGDAFELRFELERGALVQVPFSRNLIKRKQAKPKSPKTSKVECFCTHQSRRSRNKLPHQKATPNQPKDYAHQCQADYNSADQTVTPKVILTLVSIAVCFRMWSRVDGLSLCLGLFWDGFRLAWSQ